MSVKICPVLLCRRSFQRIFPQLEIFFDPGRNLAERGYKLLIINYGYIPVLGTWFSIDYERSQLCGLFYLQTICIQISGESEKEL
jgi:hypothetical protein